MSQKSVVKNSSRVARAGGLGFFLMVLGGLLAVLFWRSFNPAWVQFANDGPLGAMMSERGRVPGVLTGGWADLNAYGYRDSGAQPAITTGLLWLLGPLGFSKFYAPLTLLFLGSCAWFCFRQLGLGALAAILGGLVAALNQDFFGVACWGVGPQAICFGLNYLAFGIVVSPRGLVPWVRYPLAGLAVGMGVMEGADIGALFSITTAICILVHALIFSASPLKGFAQGMGRVAVIAVFAAWIAASTLVSLIGTQIEGVAGMSKEQRSKEEGWAWATQLGSMAKIETLGALVPGIFGYRMDSPDGGQYWGKAGRDPAWDQYFASGKQGDPPRERSIRFGGAGAYEGILVLMASLWAAVQSFRKERSVFSAPQRKFIWFLIGAMVVCLLLAFGRYAPFYRIFYALPYASVMRIPAKFYHVLQWLLLILFAYGLYGLSQRYVNSAATATRGLVEQWRFFWTKGPAFDRKWVMGCGVAIGVAIVGWLVYGSMRNNLLRYLEDVQFDSATAEAIARFSIRHAGWFIVLLTAGSGLFALVLSGYFSGRRMRIGAILLGLFLVGDLTQAGRQWIVTYNWKERYLEATDNALFDFFRSKPNLHRVSILPRWLPEAVGAPQQLVGTEGMLEQIYRGEWMQHQFQYFNIQSLDIIQMPRVPQDIAAFESALQFDGLSTNLYKIGRRWQLTNTRYILGAAPFAEAIKLFDPEQKRFTLAMAFELYQREAGGPILTRTNSTGPFAVFEFTGALPRAKLYSDWQVSPNDQATLTELANKTFDSSRTVLVAKPLPAVKTGAQTNANAGTVEFVSYAPKHIALRAKAQSPCVLLLNDKHDPNWKVIVDGKPSPLLRCNYIMRGVHLAKPGEHRVEFRFQPPLTGLYVSLAALLLGMLLLGYVIFFPARYRETILASKSESSPKPVSR